MRTIVDYELVDHGIENSQYFQGCGTSFTEYEHVATGCGNDPREAVDDALEQLAQNDWETEGMEKRIIADGWFGARRKVPSKPSVPANADDCYYYLSIRVKG